MEMRSPTANISQPALAVKTTRQADGYFRTDWQTAERCGHVLTRPPSCDHRLAVAELLGLHAVTGLIRPLRFRDFERKAALYVSVPAIQDFLSGIISPAYLKPYVRFMALSLGDLPIETKSHLVQWPDRPSAHLESLELVRHDPWDDHVHLPDGRRATPTRRAIEQVQNYLTTTQQWKAWASLLLSSHKTIRLPSMANGDGRGEQYLCPKFGWILIVKNDQIIAVNGTREEKRPRSDPLREGFTPKIGTKAFPAMSVVLRKDVASITERCHLVRDFLLSQLDCDLKSLLGDDLSNVGKAISLLLDAALDSIAKPIERATILRTFVSALPESLSHLSLPDGTKASITGHVIDRLMTRFNVRSPISGLRMLHKHAANLQVVQLPVQIQVAHQVHYLSRSTHWRAENDWTLVEADGFVVTVYYPAKQKTNHPGHRSAGNVHRRGEPSHRRPWPGPSEIFHAG